MLVKLKRNFQAGNAVSYRQGQNGDPTEIPNEFRDTLPRDAVVVDEKDNPVEVDTSAKDELHRHDPQRAAGEAEDAVLKRAGLAGLVDASKTEEPAKEPEVTEPAPEPQDDPRDKPEVFTMENRGGGYFNVVSSHTGERVNDKALRKDVAAALVRERQGA